MCKISIIVPIYNVELYLSKCIESLINQDLPQSQFEIILINDGSTDRSYSIAKKFASANKNIYLLSQENQGLSEARNVGLSKSKGEYIWFIDSDDWIESNILRKLYEKCRSNDLDILGIERVLAYEWGNKNINVKTNFIGDKISGIIFFNEGNFPKPVQLYIIKREYLQEINLRFTKGLLHEDKEFTPKAIFCAKHFMYSGCIVYFHRQRTGSITKTINPKRCYDLIYVTNSLIQFANEFNLQGGSKKIAYREAFFSLTYCALLNYDLETENDKRMIKNEIEKLRSVSYSIIRNDRLIYKLEALLLIISTSLFAYVFKRIR